MSVCFITGQRPFSNCILDFRADEIIRAVQINIIFTTSLDSNVCQFHNRVKIFPFSNCIFDFGVAFVGIC
jgi:hypothetical protein